MRPYIELAEIGLKLHNLEEIKELLNSILEDVDLVKKKGELWIEEKETSTFMEMKQFITEKTSEILKRCTSVTKENHEINSSLSSQLKGKRKLPESGKDQENSSEEKKKRVLETEKVFDEKLANFEKELTVGLQDATDFMLELENQCETLSQEINDIKEKEANIQIDVNNKIEHMLEVQQGFKITLDDLSKRLSIVEYFCEETGRSDVPCFEDCIHFIGHHEQQISEGGEADLLTHLADCNRNPGHKNFIPVDKFNLKNLPQAHQNTDMFEFIKVVAELTVRITVSMTSPLRPEFWPNTKVPYFLYNIKESQSLRTGSGMVNEVIKGSKGTCKCETCQRSDIPNQEWWTITVRTAANLILVSVEGSYMTLRWFYDTEDSPENLDRRAVQFEVYKVIFQVLCWFDYITCDTNLVKKVEKSMQQYYYLYDKVNEKNKETKDVDKFMFIVSHPHGCSKMISIGQWKEKFQVKNYFDKFIYSTCACPGSSGASVHFVGYKWGIHGGTLKSGLGYSSA